MKSDFFFLSQKLLTERGPQRQPIQNISIAIHSISIAGYVTAVLALSACCEPPARDISAVSVIFEN